MQAELRADGLHISGYVNVPGRQSRPVITRKHGKVIEVIEQRAFERAIAKAKEIELLLDHNVNRVLATTANDSLQVKEDEVGLRAEAVITDEEVIEHAKKGKLRGWSFNMKKAVDSLEERAEGLPIRHVKDFDMSEISLILNKIPCYSSTSIELRAEDEEEIEVETRAMEDESNLVETPAEDAKETDRNYKYKNRLQKTRIM